jgi:hypothetical protein
MPFLLLSYHGFNTCLIKHQKKLCPTYPLYIGMYGLIDSTWARMEGENIEEYHFKLERTQMHDPLGIIEKHRVEMKISFPY